MHRGQGLQVERREWSDGYALFTWDLTPDRSGSRAHLHPDYRGQVTIKGVFTQGTNTVVTLIVYGEFVDIMEIDANKIMTYDLAQGEKRKKKKEDVVDSRSGRHDDAGPCSVLVLSWCPCQQRASVQDSHLPKRTDRQHGYQ